MLKTISLILMAIVQTISGEATKRNEEKRSFLHHCHRRRRAFGTRKPQWERGNTINTIMKEDSIKNITCHVSVQWLDDYDLGKNESSRSFHEPLTTPVLFPSRNALSHLYSANSTASLCAHGRVYSFSHCSVTLNIAGNNAVQKSTSDGRRGYKCTFIE